MSDIFRLEYKKLSDDQIAYMNIFKNRAQQLFDEFTAAAFLNPDSRMMAIAKTKLEESVMWAVKGITG